MQYVPRIVRQHPRELDYINLGNMMGDDGVTSLSIQRSSGRILKTTLLSYQEEKLYFPFVLFSFFALHSFQVQLQGFRSLLSFSYFRLTHPFIHSLVVMKTSLLSLALAYASMVSAETTQWEDYTVTLTPSTMYKEGSSTSSSSSPTSSSSSQPSSSSSSSSSSDQLWSTAWTSGFSTAYTSSWGGTPSSPSSQPSSSSSSSSPSSSPTELSSQWSTAWTSGFSTAYTWGGTPSSSPQPSSTSSSASSPPAPSSSGTPTSSGGAGGSQTMDAETASTLLALQNEKRAKHQDTSPLTWSDSLSAWAYGYADSLKGTAYDPCSGSLKHSSNRNNQGENIAYASYANWDYMIDMWYNEIQSYDYNDITGIYHDGTEVGHFTQLVWAASQEVGCAAVQCPNDGTYLLCEYSPEGNIYDGNPGEDEFSLFRENVKPLK